MLIEMKSKNEKNAGFIKRELAKLGEARIRIYCFINKNIRKPFKERFCDECIHFASREADNSCMHPKNLYFEEKIPRSTCCGQRSFTLWQSLLHGYCGPYGRFFEPTKYSIVKKAQQRGIKLIRR